MDKPEANPFASPQASQNAVARSDISAVEWFVDPFRRGIWLGVCGGAILAAISVFIVLVTALNEPIVLLAIPLVVSAWVAIGAVFGGLVGFAVGAFAMLICVDAWRSLAHFLICMTIPPLLCVGIPILIGLSDDNPGEWSRYEWTLAILFLYGEGFTLYLFRGLRLLAMKSEERALIVAEGETCD